MAKQGDGAERETGPSTRNSKNVKLPLPKTSPLSYVYPVRSLLSGIQPAPDQKRKPQNRSGQPTTDDLSYVDEILRNDSVLASRTSTTSVGSPSSSIGIASPQPLASIPRDSYFNVTWPESDEGDVSSSESWTKLHVDPPENAVSPSNVLHGRSPRMSPQSFNESDSSWSRTFTVALPITSALGTMTEVKSPDGNTLTYTRADDRDPDEDNPRHPVPFSSVAADGLVDAKGIYHDSSSHLDFDSGIVHLPPMPLSSQSSRPSSTRPPIVSQSLSPAPEHRSVLSSQKNISDEHLVTFRFEHVQDEHGHLVVVGRDGMLTRCEDEPIRTPNAVQGFGVLIAVNEDEVSGNLTVRQVSENSFELLGLSPKHLFSLDCFTQSLPDTQADILWDNVQFLTDPDVETDDSNDVPHVFLLSGWGEPGSAISEDGATDDKRFWTCWCAAHRPPSADPDVPSNLIILEFELERDLYNPLYPPFPSSSASSSRDSGGSHGSSRNGGGSSGGGSTDNSQSTATGTTQFTPVSSTPALQISENSSAWITPPDSTPSQESDNDFPRSLTSSPLPGQYDQAVASSGGYVEEDFPSPEDILESTTSYAKPLRALERMRQISRRDGSGTSVPKNKNRRGNAAKRGGLVGTMDVFAVLTQINDQLGTAPDLDTFVRVVVGVIKDLTQFHRVLVYQFDESWNGQVVAELVDWSQTHELYRGLHFPAGDIPAQARQLYSINKVRILYDRSQTTARLVVRSKEDLDPPLDMTHCYLRAMSPIHLKYLGNMGVRASMSVSIMAFGALWGLITCHSYGVSGMRVSFPVRQMLRLLSDSISRNIERLSYAKRLQTRKLISTLPTDTNPTGYIVSNAEDLLGLFDADFGVLVVGEGAKILGPNQRGQEILIVAEYLRLKQYNLMQVSQHVGRDFPDLQLPSGLDAIAGLLYVPLSSGGKDFIALLRKGQLRDVRWAGKPGKEDTGPTGDLEPRTSFKTWSETIAGRCRAWTDEQLETAGVLALVYGKFIEVWRQKESALQSTQLTTLLLANASHEVRTPLNHIINYLEMALSASLDSETRENLTRSHTASKSLLFTINDLLDLTRLESGNETSFNEPFDLRSTIIEATHLYIIEATRRNIEFQLDIAESPQMVLGDAQKIRTVVANLTANAVKYTMQGTVTVAAHIFKEASYLRDANHIAVEIVVSDTGCGIFPEKLESIFREFEQVESAMTKTDNSPGLGLGLAVVARIVEQLGGQLRVDSRPNHGSRFSFLIPFALCNDGSVRSLSPPTSIHSSLRGRSRTSSSSSGSSQIDSLVHALSSNHMADPHTSSSSPASGLLLLEDERSQPLTPPVGVFEVQSSMYPVRSDKVDGFDLDKPSRPDPCLSMQIQASSSKYSSVEHFASSTREAISHQEKLRVLIVEDDRINRTILAKRLTLDGHDVVTTTNGQECVEKVKDDRDFDCILMDIQMPILNGFEATQRIREMERTSGTAFNGTFPRPSLVLNGRIPIFAVSASLLERQRHEMFGFGMDGWILKPIDFRRLHAILKGIGNLSQRSMDVYQPGCSWERGGWLTEPGAHLAISPKLEHPL